jgi:predicted  nucleic acid-binding Zn-ribbon protein
MFFFLDISQRVSSIALVQMACQYLDAQDEPFNAERDAVRRSVKQIEREIDNISVKVEKASDLLRRIIEICDHADHREVHKITREFDNVVREANVDIRSCDIHLEGANENIKSLLFKINSIRWAHRGMRLGGFGLSAYYFYGKYCDGTINMPSAFLAGGFSLVMWLAIFPTKAYKYYNQLNDLQQQHDEMRRQLTILREKLQSANDHKRKVTNKKK